MRIVLLGPPGSGKGTQAAILAEALGVPAISTGDLFRAHVSSGTELGRRTAALAASGDLVPDDVTTSMVVERLADADCLGGYLLDGFPRTIGQAERLRDELAAAGTNLDAVLELVVDDDELTRRMAARRVLVDGTWVVRDDDRPETVRHRLEVYRRLTAPLVDYYAAEGLLRRVVADGEVAAVAAGVRAAVDDRTGRPPAGDALRARLRTDLVAAMKSRRPDAVAALRTAIAAIDNAEAVAGPDRAPETASEHVAGAATGVGSTEAARRALSPGEVRALLRAQVEDRDAEADRYDTHQQHDLAGRLRREADALRQYLEG
jgi:adenylate kinase